MVRCRKCRELKWKGDICPTCTFGLPAETLKASKTSVITVNVKHGFHAECVPQRRAG